MGSYEILKNMSVLYVEDDEITQIVVRQILKEYVGKVYIASDGEEGYKMFMKYKPEIVITDLKMPVVDGLSLIKEIRKTDSKTGIIITTESNELDQIFKSIDIGIDKYLVKPLEPIVIAEALEIVLKKYISRRETSESIGSLKLLEKDWKNSVCDAIKGQISTFLKKKTKKGPSSIHVMIKEQETIILMNGVLTQLEKSLLANKTNVQMIAYNRELLYKEYQNEIEKIVYDELKYQSNLKSIKVIPLEDKEELVLGFSII